MHIRTRDELLALLPHETDRMFFMPDTILHKALARFASVLPGRLAGFVLSLPLQMLTQARAKKTLRRLIATRGVTIVHQPIPVSPKFPSRLYHLGVPVIIGPMNGNMNYPPGFEHLERKSSAMAMNAGRFAGNMMNKLIPGKLRAAALLVANGRTRAGLPGGCRGEIIELVENGVDLDVWRAPRDAVTPSAGDGPTPVEFAFLGRFVGWKCIDILLDAFAPLAKENTGGAPCRLVLIGDGPMRGALEQQVDGLGIRSSVEFTGFLPQEQAAARLLKASCLVLPSVLECGGAVVLEAMALGLPVIATDWGGPADYLDATCGILVEPAAPAEFARRLEAALRTLAFDPALRRRLGEAGRQRVREQFDWQEKVGRVIKIYETLIYSQRPDD